MGILVCLNYTNFLDSSNLISNIVLIFGVSNVIRYDHFLWLKRNRIHLERGSGEIDAIGYSGYWTQETKDAQ